MNRRSLAVWIIVLFALSVNAQIHDGMPQRTKYKLFFPISGSIDGRHQVFFSPYFSYKYSVTDWFSAMPLLQYYQADEEVSAQMWLSLNYKKKYYFMSRSIYDIRSKQFRETLTATVRLPLGIAVDASWDNMYNGVGFLDDDRLQVVGGTAFWKIVWNAGYSMRHSPGIIANLRFVASPYRFFQLKYDGGLKTFGGSLVVLFD